MAHRVLPLGSLALTFLLTVTATRAFSLTYSESFDSYPDGAVPAGWVKIDGPGIMGISQGAFAQLSNDFHNWTDYAYTGAAFGEAIYQLKVNVSDVAYNNTLFWRWNLGSTALQLVLRTSPLIPPEEHSRIYLFVNGNGTVLADSDVPFTGLHDVSIVDMGNRAVVSIDGSTVFDVNVPTTLADGYFGVNPGDWGSGGYYDDVSISTGLPTRTHAVSWGRIKSLYSGTR